MENLAKQARSRKRIEKIFETAENLLEQRGLDAITIANIAKYSDLKRTSTYKFFPMNLLLGQVLLLFFAYYLV